MAKSVKEKNSMRINWIFSFSSVIIPIVGLILTMSIIYPKYDFKGFFFSSMIIILAGYASIILSVIIPSKKHNHICITLIGCFINIIYFSNLFGLLVVIGS